MTNEVLVDDLLGRLEAAADGVMSYDDAHVLGHSLVFRSSPAMSVKVVGRSVTVFVEGVAFGLDRHQSRRAVAVFRRAVAAVQAVRSDPDPATGHVRVAQPEEARLRMWDARAPRASEGLRAGHPR
jgi:hypothetical protein